MGDHRTEAANHLRLSGTAFHAPDLSVREAGNILWKNIRRAELTQEEAELACGILRLANIEHAMGRLALRALQMAAALAYPVHDASHPALAQTLNIPMVTADRRLVNKVAAIGMSAFPVVVLPG